jgi:hypothetical protein
VAVSDDNTYDPASPLPLTFELHEALALAVLYEAAPASIDLMVDDVWWGESVDLAMLRIGEALAKFTGHKEMLLRGGAIRAHLDQHRATG